MGRLRVFFVSFYCLVVNVFVGSQRQWSFLSLLIFVFRAVNDLLGS